MQRWPSPKATKRLRARVRELTNTRYSGKDVKQIIAELAPVLRGWGNYFRTGNADREFKQDGRLRGEESAALALPARWATTDNTCVFSPAISSTGGVCLG